jgi:hypothetical protein
MLDGLKDALRAEDAERANLANMRQRIEAAACDKARALARRKTAVAKLAAGGSETEAARVDQAIRAAESTIAVMTEAAILAESRLRDAESATETILRTELQRRAAIAAEEFAAAEAAVLVANEARHVADQRLRVARQAAGLPAKNLRLTFSNEIYADA